jgi:DNA-3-methyladenine glycosylase II
MDGIWFYPRPEDIAALSYEDLRQLQFSGRKAEYIIDTSRLIAEGKLNLEKLREASDEEVMKALLPIRGIGPWTVQNFLLFGLGRPNLFPKADIGIQNAIKQLLHLEQKPSYEQMEELSKNWEPYLSYASLYLWRSIE